MHFSNFCVLAFLVLSICLLGNAQNPNFILFMADDVGYGDLGVYGSPTIETPHLDRLAQEGMRFTQWYTPASVCTPSRGATMTGRLPGRIGFYSRYGFPADYLYRVFYPSSVGGLPQNETTIAGYLQQKGYYSAMIGKWHLGHNGSLPVDRGFDYFFGAPYSHDEGYPGPFPMSLIWPPVPIYENRLIVEQPIDVETITQRMTANAINVIETSHQAQKPFFLYLGYHEAHIPLFTAEEFVGRSRRGRYGDMMYQMDDSIGQIISKLEELQIDNNTLVFFVSDNGAWPEAQEPFTFPTDDVAEGGSNGPFREGKGSTWEGGHRSPAIAYWPGKIRPNSVNREIAGHMDILPTILEIVGIPLPPAVTFDGKSITSLLFDSTSKTPHEFYFFWREKILMAARSGPYKLHLATRSGFGFDRPLFHDPPLLFNVESDPGEKFPLNNTNLQSVVDHILQGIQAHQQNFFWGPPQYDTPGYTIPGQSWKVIPCCKKQLNEMPDAETDAPPPGWPLIVWRDCICPIRPKSLDSMPGNVFSTLEQMMTTKYHGRSLNDWEHLLGKIDE